MTYASFSGKKVIKKNLIYPTMHGTFPSVSAENRLNKAKIIYSFSEKYVKCSLNAIDAFANEKKIVILQHIYYLLAEK
ncbi:MAG: hypothetical protein IKO26_09645 [Paludibacteraceae bacterium]|nr:hypothetical protein [Paludibacteraceae bacterium]